MADLITLNEYKALTGLDPTNTHYDAMVTAMIPAASRAVATYTGRDFGSALVTETRTFQYDGSGFLDIDDCVSVLSVSLTVSGAVDAVVLRDTEYLPMPPRRDDSPVYYYILMPGAQYGGISGEMGFTRNLDVYMAEGRYLGMPPVVNVTAQWGWPVVPDDVKLATAWTISEWRARSDSEGLASESIESYSRAYSRGEQGQEVFAVPSRVRDILAMYAKVNV